MANISLNQPLKVKSGSVATVRTGPAYSYPAVATITRSDGLFTASKYGGGNYWCYISVFKGWVPVSLLEVASDKDLNVLPVAQAAGQKNIKNTINTEDIFNTTVQQYLDETNSIDASLIPTKTLDGIMGVPYQFMESVDPRIPNTIYGRTYAERIVTRMPLLLLSPGRVNFLSEADKNTAAQTLQEISNSVEKLGVNVDSNKLIRYYTFDFDYTEYYQYVNMMMGTGAQYLGIQDVKIKCQGEDKKIGAIDWMKMGQSEFKSLVSTKEYVAFYVDSAASSTDSLSNSTTESSLANSVNSVQDAAREIQFLTGMTGKGSSYFEEDAERSVLNSVDDFADKYLNGSQLFSDIMGNFSTVAMGGRLIFPEIWADSDFTKDYDINIKLRTPDKDPVSWYMNIYRPLTYLICMTAPRQSDNPNGYKSPFLVRGFYKGLFNCDMGMITSLNISRGKESAWTLNGLPTEVDVSVSIKDLYSALTINKEQDAANFINNIALISYIGNSCGVNINDIDVNKMADIYLMLKTNKYRHLPNNIWSDVQQEFSNRTRSLGRDLLQLIK